MQLLSVAAVVFSRWRFFVLLAKGCFVLYREGKGNIMADKSSDLSETYISSDRADAWHRAKQRREESTGAVTELLLDLADLRPGDRVLDVAAGTGDSSLIALVVLRRTVTC